MSRFSPTVTPYVGKGLAGHLRDAFGLMMQERQRRKQEGQADEDRTQQMDAQELQLAMQGLHRGPAPREAATPMGGGFAMTTPTQDVTQPAGPMFDLSKIAPVTQAPSRYTQLTPGFYRDDQQVATEQARTSKVQFQQALGKALAEAQGKIAADPEGYRLGQDKTRAEIDRSRASAEASRAAASRPQAPVFGTDEWKAGQSWLLSQQEAKERRLLGMRQAGDQALASTRASAAPKGKPIPASAVEKLVAIDNIVSMGEEVARELESAQNDGRNITGRMFGVIPTATWMKNAVGMGNRGASGDDQRGTDVRALIGNLYATVAKERGGTALSANEIRLLESYLPSENDDEQTAHTKALRFVGTLKTIRRNKEQAYQRYGYGAGVADDELPLGDQMSGRALPNPEY